MYVHHLKRLFNNQMNLSDFRAELFSFPKPRTESLQTEGLSHYGVALWNDLPYIARSADSKGHRIYHHFLSSENRLI